MATMITSECINCGACEPECPNTAIYQGGVEWELDGVNHSPIATDFFYIVPEKCTECVGFHDHEACAAVCPVDCCIPNPDIPETQEVLFERAKKLHPGDEFPADYPSRFKEGGGTAAEPSAASPPAAEAASAPPATAPAAAPAPALALAAPALAIPEIDDWEVPIECFHCHGSYGVAFRHYRSGVVFRCPFCSGSLVVTLPMHRAVAQALRQFHHDWIHGFEAFQQKRQRELEDFENEQSRSLQEFNESLKARCSALRPPGAPRKRAWIFG